MRYKSQFLVLMILFILFLIFINKSQTIKIGFVAQLTGAQSELGIQERNAVQMAVEEINDQGGIEGRKILLIIKDDVGTEEGAKEAVNQLILEDVVAIIGHATSSQTVYGLEIANKAKKLLISPTASTYDLGGKDDFLLRVVASNKERAEAFAKHISQEKRIEELSVVLDIDNPYYVDPYWEAFKSIYEKEGKVKKVFTFSSKNQPDFNIIAEMIKNQNSTGVLVIANDYDTAMLAQSLENIDKDFFIFASAWAQTQTLINHGGQAVEGIEVEVVYPQDGDTPNYIAFKDKYIKKFGAEPSFGAVLGYESMTVLRDALKKTGGKEKNLKQAILEIQKFEGLIDYFEMDIYGDVKRPFYFSKIEDGRFITITDNN